MISFINYASKGVAFCLLLAGCGGGSSTPSTNPDGDSSSGDSILTGVFLDSPVEGVAFATETQSGTTNAAGEFMYLAGEQVTFSIGAAQFPAVTAAAQVSPVDIAASSDNPTAMTTNIARLLQSLDLDGNPVNGITISADASTSASQMNFDVSTTVFENSAEVINLVANSGSVTTALISADAANAHLSATLADSPTASTAPTITDFSLTEGTTPVLTVSFSTDMTREFKTEGEYVPSRTYWQDPRIFVVEFESVQPGGSIRLIPEFFIAVSGDTLAEGLEVAFTDNSDAAVTAACAADPASINTVSGAFRYEDIAGADFIWVGDDDETGKLPLRLKMGEDCILRASRGYEDFGDTPGLVAQWQYTVDGAIRINDFSDQFSLVRTTSVAHEICWASFSSCAGEGQFRSEGGVRRLFFNEADAREFFDSL